MRLLQLSLCAFGPYKTEQIIDFTKINDRKLFLITGPTGAGKTTIFDAISYALFGQSSGNSRDGDSFRSDFSSLDEETYVALGFQIKGINYFVKRSPKQERKKVKGEGTTTKQADAVLEIENGKTYTGVTEVTSQIQEILGINYNQFRQIVMLPQGEFRKLLEANSQDREVIFRKLFKTEDFLAIQENLKTKVSALKMEIGDVYKLLNNYISQIICDENSSLDIFNKKDYKDYEHIIVLLNEKINEDEALLSQVQELMNKNEKEIFNFTSEISNGNMVNQKYKQRDELVSHKNTLLDQKEMIQQLEIKVNKANFAQVLHQIEEEVQKLERTFEDLKEKENMTFEEEKSLKSLLTILDQEVNIKHIAVSETTQLNEMLFGLNDKLEKYQIYEEKVKALTSLEKQKNQMASMLQEKKSNIVNLKEQINSFQLTLENYQRFENQNSDNKIKLETLNNQIKNETLQLSILDDIHYLMEEHIRLSDIYQKKNEDYKNSKQQYDEKFELYRLGQAGLLAQGLLPHTPCPVCGSMNHPNKAILLEAVPSVEMLDGFKKQLELKEKTMSDSYHLVYSRHSAIVEKKNLYDKLIEGKSIDLNIEKQRDYVEKLLHQDRQNLSELKALMVLLEKKRIEKKEIEEKQIDLVKKISQKEEELQQYINSYNQLNNDYEVKSQMLKQNEETILKDYPNKESLSAEIKRLKNQIDMINKAYKEVFEQRQKKLNDLLIVETNLVNIKKSKVSYQHALQVENELIKEKLTEFQFASLEDYRLYLYTQDELKKFQITIRNYYEEVSYVNKTISQLDEELSNCTVIDIDKLIEKLSLVKESYEVIRNEEKEYHLILQTNRKIKLDMENLYKTVKNKMEAYEILSDISKAANGDNPQKLTFERYVLAAYFDEIIEAANIRLSDMSNNRYYLCRKEEKGKGASQQGLDLEVVDNYTSKNRLVKTLSGGEAFITSLALALGLADVVQGYSGGIQLDTIFIDEGFGSLDPESLEHAIATLVNIQKTGRLVGIISHVQELKERIEVKLEITTTHQGSTAQFVY